MNRLPIWDIHHHWVNESGYIDRLLRQMDRLGIERTGLIAMGDLVGDLFVRHGPAPTAVSDEDLARLVRQHPDRFWGWGFVQPGRHGPTHIDRLADLGLAGLKFHVPLKPYGEPEYFPLYERAQALGLPCLFHTGLFSTNRPMPGLGIRSEYYRPIHLEPLAHEFPHLKVIMAHLGVCWNEEAAALCRVCPHFYADLSGRRDGWRRTRSAEAFRRLFHWPSAHQKILFGSDVHADELETAVRDQIRLFRRIGWTGSKLAAVLRDNGRRLFA